MLDDGTTIRGIVAVDAGDAEMYLTPELVGMVDTVFTRGLEATEG